MSAAPYLDDDEWIEAWVSKPEDRQPMRQLWFAVLLATVNDYLAGVRKGFKVEKMHLNILNGTKSGGTRYTNECSHYNFTAAANWLFSDEMSPRSFLWLCDHLDIDPIQFRGDVLVAATRHARDGDKAKYAFSRLPPAPKEELARRLEAVGQFEYFTVRDVMQVANLEEQPARSQVVRWLKRNEIVRTHKQGGTQFFKVSK